MNKSDSKVIVGGGTRSSTRSLAHSTIRRRQFGQVGPLFPCVTAPNMTSNMACRTIDALLWTICAAVLVALVMGQQREVEVFVNVYNHPKTGFSCADKAPGQYYADPATKCAVYYVCIPNPTGTLSPQSFACPNGTIFSQATRVCRPHEEVYCQLAARYYDNAQGIIDEKGEFEVPPVVPVAPAVHPVPAHPHTHAHHPRRQSVPRAPKPQTVSPQPQTPPPPPPQSHARTPVSLHHHSGAQSSQAQPLSPQRSSQAPQQSNLFNSNSRYRNARPPVSQPTTTTTSTTPSPPPPPPPPPPPARTSGGGGAGGAGGAGGVPADYEYDYSDYGNETAQASNVHAQIIANVAEAIAKDTKESAAAAAAAAIAVSVKSAEPSVAASNVVPVVVASPVVDSAAIVTTDDKTGGRRKRDTEAWMLARRKGQFNEPLTTDVITVAEPVDDQLVVDDNDDNEQVEWSSETTTLATTSTDKSTTTPVSSTAFTCEDKIAGVAYADVASGCADFYLCVTVGKAKQQSYHLSCDKGRRFNQALGMCDPAVSDRTCARSEQYYAYHKWHKPSKKHLMQSAKKMTAAKQ